MGWTSIIQLIYHFCQKLLEVFGFKKLLLFRACFGKRKDANHERIVEVPDINYVIVYPVQTLSQTFTGEVKTGRQSSPVL